MERKIEEALEHYRRRTGHALERPVVVFDMDGILFDSMPAHTIAWKQVCDENGIEAERNEFYSYEGRTGASTIDTLIRRQFGRPATDEEKHSLYERKCVIFKSILSYLDYITLFRRSLGALLNLNRFQTIPLRLRQMQTKDRLDREFEGAFPDNQRVTAYDVKRGKPDPEPYIIGMGKAGARAWQAVGVDNAPLGVESSSRSGAFTIGVRTGPLAEGSLLAAGADIEVNSMYDCAKIISELLYI